MFRAVTGRGKYHSRNLYAAAVYIVCRRRKERKHDKPGYRPSETGTETLHQQSEEREQPDDADHDKQDIASHVAAA